MAKYTETFAEYLDNGGVIPSSSFALIEDFEDLFKERYCGSEIGFETEALFALKLDYKARVVMPFYADRVTEYINQMTGLRVSPDKWRFETRKYGKQHSSNKTDGSNTDLPFDATTANPTSLSNLNGSADVDEHTDTLDYKEGLSVDERLRVLDAVNKRINNLLDECLDEFKPLFMGIY